MRRQQRQSLPLCPRGEAGRKPRSAGPFASAMAPVNSMCRVASTRPLSSPFPISTTPRLTPAPHLCVQSRGVPRFDGAFSNLFNARSVLDGLSLSKRESWVSQWPCPSSASGMTLVTANLGASAFDGEGTPTARLLLIEGGILRQFLHSEARRGSSVASTGCAAEPRSPSAGCLKSAPLVLAAATLNRFKLMVWCGLILSALTLVSNSQVRSRPRWLACRGGERRSIEAATVAGDIRQVLKSLLAEGEARTPDGLCPHVWWRAWRLPARPSGSLGNAGLCRAPLDSACSGPSIWWYPTRSPARARQFLNAVSGGRVLGADGDVQVLTPQAFAVNTPRSSWRV